MSKAEDNEIVQRLDALELKLMDVENTVSELNQVIVEQYREIEQLKTNQLRLGGLIDSLQQSASGASGESDNSAGSSGTSAADEVPPHY